MKNTLLLLLLLLLPAQSCLPNGITFSNQVEVDQFPAMYPGCTTIEGDVFVRTADVTNPLGVSVRHMLVSVCDAIRKVGNRNFNTGANDCAQTSVPGYFFDLITGVSSILGITAGV